MDPTAFRADLELVPDGLTRLAGLLDERELVWPLDGQRPRRVLLTGMGSSFFAALVVAQRLRALGLDAVAERSSAERTWPADPDLLVVPISATGGSVETLTAVDAHQGRSRVVALTNTPGSPLTDRADATVELHAGPERGGVACRTFRHTIVALLALEAALADAEAEERRRRTLSEGVRRAAAASAYLLDRADGWLPGVLDALTTPDGTWFLAPVERLSSALQGALMVREGPRRRADGCETGDWSHVDVYLTKTHDYRAVVFTGSRWDAAAAAWMQERGSTTVAVGGAFPGARVEVRYPGDDDPIVAVLTEVLVAELVAATWWSAANPA